MINTFQKFVLFLMLLFLGGTYSASAQSGGNPYHYGGKVAQGGSWEADLSFSADAFVTGGELVIDSTVQIHSLGLSYNLAKTRGLYCLVTGSRLFDGSGQFLGDGGGLVSTSINSLGIPVEGEEFRVPHTIFGSDRISPIASYVVLNVNELQINTDDGEISGSFRNVIPITDDIPAGYYKIRLDFGIEVSSTMRITLSGVDPSSEDSAGANQTYADSRLIGINTQAPPRMIWTLFSQFHPGGGVIALEDKGLAGLSRRRGSFERCIIPLKDSQGTQVRYLLEPDFPAEANPFIRRNSGLLGLEYSKGWVSLRVQNPDGTVIECGDGPFIGLRGLGATSGSNSFFFSFSQYGKHLIECKGWVSDEFGTVYEGGGIYEVWVAQPLMIVPSTPAGKPVETGELYNSAVHVYPPFPAYIEIKSRFKKKSLSKIETDFHKVKANRFGSYFPDAGDARKRSTRSGIINFKEPGLYSITYRAEYEEEDGTIWMGQAGSFGIVYDKSHSMEAFGTETHEAVLPFPDTDKPTRMTFHSGYPEDSADIVYLPEENYTFFDPLLTFNPTLFPDVFHGDEDVLVDIADKSGLRSGTGKFLNVFSYPEEVFREGFQYFSSVRSDGIPQMAFAELTPGEEDHSRKNPFNLGELPRDQAGDYYLLSGGLHFADLDSEKYLQIPYVTGAFVSSDYAKPIYYPAGEIYLNKQLYPRKTFVGFPVIYPGEILRDGGAYIADSVLFPCTGSDFEIVLTYPDGSVRRKHGSSNRFGFIGGPENWLDLEGPGVYRVSYIVYRGEGTGYPLGTTEDNEGSFNVYVIDGGYYNRVNFRLPMRSEIIPGAPFLLSGDVTGSQIVSGEANITVSFQGGLVEESVVEIIDGQFAYNLNTDDVRRLYTNYSAHDPNDRLDITFFVTGLTESGKIRYAAEKLYTLGRHIYAIPFEYDDIKAGEQREYVEPKGEENKKKDNRKKRGLRG